MHLVCVRRVAGVVVHPELQCGRRGRARNGEAGGLVDPRLGAARRVVRVEARKVAAAVRAGRGKSARGDESPGASGAGDLHGGPSAAALEAIREERRGPAASGREVLPGHVRAADRHREARRREGAAALAGGHGVGAVGQAGDGVIVRGVARGALRPGGDSGSRRAGAAGNRIGGRRHRHRPGHREAAGGIAVHADPPGARGRVGCRAGLVAGRGIRAADICAQCRLCVDLRVDVDVGCGVGRCEGQIRGARRDSDVVVLPGALGHALAGHGHAAGELRVAGAARGGEVRGDVGRGDGDGARGGGERAARLARRDGVSSGREARHGVVARGVARGGVRARGDAGSRGPDVAADREGGRRARGGEVDTGDVG